MLSFISLAMGTKLGRYAIAGVLGMAAIALAVARVFASGKAYERAKDNETKLIQLNNAVRANEEVAGLSHSDRVDYLNGWLRNE